MRHVIRQSGVMNLQPQPIFRFVIGDRTLFVNRKFYYKLKDIFEKADKVVTEITDLTKGFYETVALNPEKQKNEK